MRKSIKLISLAATIAIFVLLDLLMFLIDFTVTMNPIVGLIMMFGLIAAALAVIVFIFLKTRQKSKIKI